MLIEPNQNPVVLDNRDRLHRVNGVDVRGHTGVVLCGAFDDVDIVELVRPAPPAPPIAVSHMSHEKRDHLFL